MIGARIKSLRKKNNITQEELGKLLFVSDKTISSWEQERTELNLNEIVILSEIFNTTPSHLIYGDIKKTDIETEIKIKLDESEFNRLNLFMKEKAKFINKTEQLDIYYNPKHRSFIQNNEIEEWIRIGKRGEKNILNYKKWYDNKYCDEYEVLIDDFKNMDKIFKIIGLEELCKVNKKRITYLYDDKYEVALDDVENLGYFVELEVKKYNELPLVEYDNLLKLAKSLELNLSNIDMRGYPYYFIKSKNKV